MKYLALLLLLLTLVACNGAGGGAVKILTNGIFSPVLFSLNDKDIDAKTTDMGERLLTEEPLVLTIKLHNSTKYDYTDVDFVLSAANDEAPAITFLPTPEGEIAFPGFAGTCKRTIKPDETCQVKVQFTPRDGRVYNEILTLSFKNFVDAETHVAKLTWIAGMPASLTFTNDITQYHFGDLVGTAQIPVVERSEDVIFSEELEIKNAGGLPAKNVAVNLVETCSSTLTNACPTGMDGAYTVTENNCPSHLMPNETCKVKIQYYPKNKDPDPGPTPDEIKEINYRSTVSLGYVKDPYGGTGVLNAYFRSVSTNIEAKFKVAVATIIFETPIVSGNRDVRTFRINNLGYREGQIKALAVRDFAGALIATCKASSTSPYLDCYNNLSLPHTLDTFPFNFKDRNNCLTTDSEPTVFINVGSGCIFDAYFQPSVTYLSDKITEFQNLQPEVIFDSHWKGLENIVTTKLFNLSAKSIAAGRLQLDKLNFDGTNYSFTGSNPWVTDMGRMTLQSANYFKRKPMIVTFKNVGSVPVTGISMKDGSGRTIPIGGAGVNLGAQGPYFYASAIASDSTCTIINPGDTCSMTLMFAPIGLDTNAEEDANMFDGVGLDLKKYKGFIVSYASGAQFTDTNFTEIPDVAPSKSEARLQATLVRKGMLMNIAEDTRNVSNFGANVNVASDTMISHIFIQNIGTGPVPYIRLQTPPVQSTSLVPTADPASLGADYDCLNLVDMDLTGTVPANANPSTRTGLFVTLPKETSCVYSVQMRTVDSLRYVNAGSCTNSLVGIANAEEGIRLFTHTLEGAGGTSLWEYCLNNGVGITWGNISVTYYDGDSSNPSLPPGSIYGARFTLPNYSFTATQQNPGKIIPYNFVPWLTATLYRPQFVLPSIGAGKPMTTIPEKWFYGVGTNYYNVLNDPSISSPFIQADDSRNFASTLSGYADRTSFDYILYLGSFPQGSGTFSLPLGFRNFGGIASRLVNFDVDNDPSFTITSIPMTFPQVVPTLADINPSNFTFNTSVAGEHRMEIEYQYQDGTHNVPLIYNSSTVASNIATAGKNITSVKLLVLAHVQPSGSHGLLSLDVNDYDVLQNPGFAPTETMQGSYPAALTWNTNAASSNLTFDTIKLTAAPTISDVYAKKRLTFTNNGAAPITDLKLQFRADANASSTKTISTYFTSLAGSNCVSGMTLNIGASCSIFFKYQPNASDTTDTFTMTALYRIGNGQYVMQNTSISLLPRSPGTLIATGKTTESINYKITPASSTVTRTSYPLNFGTFTLDVVPKPLNFDQLTGTFQKLTFTNTQPTKSSLLLAYQKYITAFSLRGYSPVSPAPTSLIPAAGEYRNYGGEDYVIISKATYSDNSNRLVFEASKGCLFGDDESNGAIAAHQKGFNNSTVKPCYVLVNFSANFEYLKKSISIGNGDDMRGTAAELWYFSVNRSSTSSVWVHVKGNINPDLSIASGSYAGIQAFENRTASFSTQKLTASNVPVGDIVGLRVLMSSTSTGLNDPYSTGITTYADIRPYNAAATQYANFLSGLSNGTYFYFRVVAIRKDLRFNDNSTPKRFVGLIAGEYLSAANNNATPLKVLIPPLNHYYFHTQKLLVEKTLYGGTAFDQWATANNKCANRTKLTVKDPSNIVLPYQLIRLSTWSLLLANPDATAYANMTQTAHWLGDNTVSIDAMCTGMPGYTPGTSSQMLTATSTFYIRNSSNPTLNVNQAVGGVPGTTYSNYMSYIDGAVGYGSARCMVALP
jgi:hypothetical protein